MKTVLITGVCGFIGYHLAKEVSKTYNVVGVDNMNDYYSVSIKEKRLSLLNNVVFIKCDISDPIQLNKAFMVHKPDIVVNLAAQAGVRYSFVNPESYIKSNIVGFHNVLECCKDYGIERLIYASSSSVYGNCGKMPCSECDDTSRPISLYAMTKKSNELEAYTYSNEYQLNTVGLRFFSVYGEYGRPDMSYYKFTDNIINNEPVLLYNHGDCLRDFTYVGDVVDAIKRIAEKEDGLCEIYNIGNGSTIRMTDFVSVLFDSLAEHNLIVYNRMPDVILAEKQQGDVDVTCACVDKFETKHGVLKHTGLKDGLDKFVKWYGEHNLFQN